MMKTICLQFPLETLDGRLLLPAGSSIHGSFLKGFLKNRRLPAVRQRLLFEHRRIESDLREFCAEKPYNAIFYSSAWTRGVFGILAGCRMRPAFFDFLDHFEKSDIYTYRHSLIVYALSVQIARVMDGPAGARRMSTVGPTHDFGKVCVPRSTLAKSTPLTAAERARLEHHTVAGFLLLAYYLGQGGGMAPVVARDHHERRDGSGYPARKKSFAREVEIVAIADVYDALISPRPYRRHCYDNRAALDELTAMGRSGKIRIGLVRALVALNRRSPANYLKCDLSLEKRGRPPAGNCHGILAS